MSRPVRIPERGDVAPGLRRNGLEGSLQALQSQWQLTLFGCLKTAF
jgi:hypothetical protein